MPYKEREIEKMYYSIGEVSKLLDVAPSLLRFWETEFDVIKPKKNKKGNRMFTQQDIKNLQTIYHLVKGRGFTLQGAKEYLKTDRKKIDTNLEMIDALKKIKHFLIDIKDKI